MVSGYEFGPKVFTAESQKINFRFLGVNRKIEMERVMSWIQKLFTPKVKRLILGFEGK